ncbi:MAG: RcnB family protein [Comamonas sp.]
MKKKLAITLAALLALNSVGAWAQNGPDSKNDLRPESGRQESSQPGSATQSKQRDNRGTDQRQQAQKRGGEQGEAQAHRHDDASHQQFARGERLPQDYRGRQYVVEDWRAHNLRQPPRGQHWVQVGGQYVLVAIATGVITSILLNQ